MLRPWVVVRERYSGMTKSPEQNDYWGILPCWRLLLNLVVSLSVCFKVKFMSAVIVVGFGMLSQP
jgi:hypothetical protein